MISFTCGILILLIRTLQRFMSDDDVRRLSIRCKDEGKEIGRWPDTNRLLISPQRYLGSSQRIAG